MRTTIAVLLGVALIAGCGGGSDSPDPVGPSHPYPLVGEWRGIAHGDDGSTRAVTLALTKGDADPVYELYRGTLVEDGAPRPVSLARDPDSGSIGWHAVTGRDCTVRHSTDTGLAREVYVGTATLGAAGLELRYASSPCPPLVSVAATLTR